MMALQKSVKNYQNRIRLFEKWLKKGLLLHLMMLPTWNEYGEDIDRAFDDYDQYLKELEDAIDGDDELVKKRGVERKNADSEIYNIEQLFADLERDKKITYFLIKILDLLTNEGKDEKIKYFCRSIYRSSSIR